MTQDNRSFQTVQSNKLGDQISNQLLEKIVSEEYPPGSRLPSERNLAEVFQASRVAVREGIGSLVAKGILSVKHGRGTTVNPISDWNTLDPHVLILLQGDQVLNDLIEFRIILEPDLAAMAAERIQPHQVDELRALVPLPDDDDVEQHAQRDNKFHQRIAQITNNPVSLIVMSSIGELLYENRRKAIQVPGELEKARAWHVKIFEAIAAKAPDAAREAMYQHMLQVKDALAQYQETHSDRNRR